MHKIREKAGPAQRRQKEKMRRQKHKMQGRFSIEKIQKKI